MKEITVHKRPKTYAPTLYTLLSKHFHCFFSTHRILIKCLWLKYFKQVVFFLGKTDRKWSLCVENKLSETLRKLTESLKSLISKTFKKSNNLVIQIFLGCWIIPCEIHSGEIFISILKQKRQISIKSHNVSQIIMSVFAFKLSSH